MPARTKLTPEDQLTIKKFLAFTDTRPQEERWELIEGVAVLNPRPTQLHQFVTGRVGAYPMSHKHQIGASWLPLFGVGIRVPVSPHSLPTPDVFVKEGPLTGLPVTDDALVIVEVLSRGNSKADQAWRRKVYASVPNCRHYVTIKAVEVDAYDRDSGWKKRTVTGLAAVLDLPALGLSMPLANIYRWTPLGPQ